MQEDALGTLLQEESVITMVCNPLAANSFARRCPWYLINDQFATNHIKKSKINQSQAKKGLIQLLSCGEDR